MASGFAEFFRTATGREPYQRRLATEVCADAPKYREAQGHRKVVDRGLRRLKTCAYISEKLASTRCRRRSLACAGQRWLSATDFTVALQGGKELVGVTVLTASKRTKNGK